ncbi:hypothetical protein GGR56DRAFT_694709 [Xylariaceae sp. FL0804]|nr:hypothetical protein GGR56DRAFT_694709 [Xylariaceae sp. FL0804]
MVGSVPGPSTEEVLVRLSTALQGRSDTSTTPDGETGERWNYVGWQLERFPPLARRTEFGGTPLPDPDDGSSAPLPTFTLADIAPTGYDDAALASYAEFARLRRRGAVAGPGHARFQIGLPSAYTVLAGHVKPELALAVEPLYEQRLGEAIDRIAAAIPHHDLVIEWDLAYEMAALESEQQQDGRRFDHHDENDDDARQRRHRVYFSTTPGDVLPGLVDRVARLCARVPRDVRLAFHLGYGYDLLRHDRHFVEPPADTAATVRLANALLAREGSIGGRVDWIHVPVPLPTRGDRTDDDDDDDDDAAYYRRYLAPLAAGLVGVDCGGARPPYVFLGLVRAGDDEEAARRRIRAARAALPFPFGVATERGLGRTPPGEIDGVLRICREVAEDGGTRTYEAAVRGDGGT